MMNDSAPMTTADESERPAKTSLLPQFSIKLVIILMTVCAVIFLVLRMAAGGTNWAWGVVSATAAGMAAFLLFALFFCVAYGLSIVTSSGHAKPKPTSPFASDTLPPQIIPPRDPD